MDFQVHDRSISVNQGNQLLDVFSSQTNETPDCVSDWPHELSRDDTALVYAMSDLAVEGAGEGCWGGGHKLIKAGILFLFCFVTVGLF